MKIRIALIVSLSFVCYSNSNAEQECYEFTGSSEDCGDAPPLPCGNPIGTNCGPYLIDDHRGSWDGTRAAAEGYSAEGGMTVVCYYGGNCVYTPNQGGATCELPDPLDVLTEADLPNVDINSVCPETFP
jgi:hypothetical protein